jgi:hypothetical protein
MKRACLIACVVLCALTASAQSPVVRAHFEPTKGILVGQPVRLIVSVFVPNYFTGSPDFPEFELENAIVVLPQDRPQNSNEQIGGTTYAGITEIYTIYPQQPGDFQLPPAQIAVSYANAPPKNTVARVALPVLTFHAEIPAAARDLDYFLPTTRLTMQQKWSSPLKNLRAGDSIERTITVTATKMQAMLIPPLPFTAPDGIRIYPEEPSVRDQKTDRGDFVYGQRTQSAKYFIQKEGHYTLPAMELKWWNLSTNRLMTAVLPAVHFTATANAGYVAELPPEPEPAPVLQTKHVSLWKRYKFWVLVAIPLCAAAFLLLWISYRYLPRLYRRIRTWREQQKHSEAAYFSNLQQACRHNRAMPAYDWLLKWLAHAYPGLPVHEFINRTGDSELAVEINHLGASLFAQKNGAANWDGRKMAALLKQHRRKTERDRKPTALPQLNP